MGEKIKNINQFVLGDIVFDVELNHGYTASTKYSIHIQNQKIRLALDDKDFLKLCGLIFRAKDELDFKKGGDIGNDEFDK